MKNFFKVLGKIVLGILAVILLWTIFVYGMRYYNDQKYKPQDYNAEDYSAPTELSQYNQEIDGVEVEHIEGEYLNGFHLKPEDKKHKGVVITFGGSEGSPAYYTAEPLAKEGYEVLSLFYFGMDNQQKELVEVPLDFFDEVLTYIDENVSDNEDITVVGASKGAELCLNLTTRYPEIDNVVLYAPTAWNYMGLSFEDYSNVRSSWTWQGEPLPYINSNTAGGMTGVNLMLDFILKRPVQYRPGYEAAAEKADNKEEARIKVEESQANLLIFAGAKDMMWQSEVSAQAIADKRPDKTEVHVFDQAGHLFLGDWYQYMGEIILAMGGDPKHNEEAGMESNQILLEKLAEWHS
ncbi:alpha/beta fold hydrolase [Facklamia lactis]|uniref:alpha/beta fold hydrolase n=1 Tax=Facklamia lactis TaxID=2749967 RepID=UPI0018CE3FE6|nr:alpha/beta fold hydrolase [Facklamia lactis]MBG9979734.1 alpha/beta hydrolase [Facklamia lactis]